MNKSNVPTLSVILITYNAAQDLARCLESVKWADEIIVWDSGSTDETLTIARRYTEQIFSSDWPGFGTQKNRVRQRAQGDWILSIDADEALSPGLIKEIRQSLATNRLRMEYVYAIPRQSFFCGQRIRYGDWGKDSVVRLFPNDPSIQFTSVPVHETLTGYTQVKYLHHPMFHYTVKTLEQMIDKVNRYSSLGAQSAYQQGKKSSFSKAMGRGFWRFFRGYVFRLGMFDGKAGFILAVFNAFEVFCRYLKLSAYP
jgi:glycosyltransferase involved in cell wall biosynthesis